MYTDVTTIENVHRNVHACTRTGTQTHTNLHNLAYGQTSAERHEHMCACTRVYYNYSKCTL